MAVFCLVAILAMAVNTAAPGIFLALLVPLFFFIAPVWIALRRPALESEVVPAIPFLAVVDSRGPPNFSSPSL
jgi:hypothetical protein